MVNGVDLQSGVSVLLHAVVVSRQEPEPAQILLLLREELTARVKTPRLRFVTCNTVQLTADGVSSNTGLTALLHAMEESRQEPEPAQILLLLMEELPARVKTPRLRIVTHKTVQLMVDGVSLDTGHTHGALLHVEEEPRLEPEPAQILLLLTEELPARVKALKLRIVIHKTVQLTADGLSSECGVSALQHVEEESRTEPEPAHVRFQLTVELTVREKPLRLWTVTNVSAQVTLI